MDMKLVLIGLALVACTIVTSKPVIENLKTIELIKSLLEKIVSKRGPSGGGPPGGGAPGGDPPEGGPPNGGPPNGGPPNGGPPNGGPPNGGPPNGGPPNGGPPNGGPSGGDGEGPQFSSEAIDLSPLAEGPVTREEVKELLSALRVHIEELAATFQTQAQLISDSGTDEKEFIKSLREFINISDKVLEVDFKKLEEHLLMLLERGTIYGGALSPPECESDDPADCFDEEKEFENAWIEVSQQMDAMRTSCQADVSPTKKKEKSAGDDGSHHHRHEHNAEELVDDIIGALDYAFTHLAASNEDLAAGISTYIMCMFGHLNDFSDMVDPDNLPEEKTEAIRSMMRIILLTYHISWEIQGTSLYLDGVRGFKEFTVISDEELVNIRDQYTITMNEVTGTFEDAIEALEKPDIFEMFDALNDQLMKLAMLQHKGSRKFDELIIRATWLGFEGSPGGCSEYLNKDTLEDLRTCALEEMKTLEAVRDDVKESIKDQIEAATESTGCGNMMGMRDRSDNFLDGLSESESEDGSEISQALEDEETFNHKVTPDDIKRDLVCLGEILELYTDVNYEDTEKLKLMVHYDEAMKIVGHFSEKVMHDLEGLIWTVISELYEKAVEHNKMKKIGTIAKTMAKTLQSSISKLKSTKMITYSHPMTAITKSKKPITKSTDEATKFHNIDELAAAIKNHRHADLDDATKDTRMLT